MQKTNIFFINYDERYVASSGLLLSTSSTTEAATNET